MRGGHPADCHLSLRGKSLNIACYAISVRFSGTASFLYTPKITVKTVKNSCAAQVFLTLFRPTSLVQPHARKLAPTDFPGHLHDSECEHVKPHFGIRLVTPLRWRSWLKSVARCSLTESNISGPTWRRRFSRKSDLQSRLRRLRRRARESLYLPL